ncbi:MAG: hypothetical protein M3N47_12485 [Chloroflexota bacterium]|nr:hypothetical protein [Chloroflexota bacterium]
MGDRDDLLDRVLNILAWGEHVRAQIDQTRAIAVDQDLIGRSVASPGKGHQVSVAQPSQQERTCEGGRRAAEASHLNLHAQPWP